MATAERDYYELLGVGRDAGDADIKKAFRRLAREVHPDVSEAPDAHERFRELAEAYEVLSDPERRRTYDRFGHAGLRQRGFQPGDIDITNLADIFQAFFGEGLFGGAQPAGPRPARGADVTAVAEVTLREAFAGTTATVPTRVAVTCERCGGDGAEPGTSPVSCPTCAGTGRFQQVTQSVFGQFVRSGTCPRCDGAGRIVETPCTDCKGAGRTLRDESLEVDVPAGIHDGQRIRLRGRGHAGTLGGPPGDVFVQVRVRPHERLHREGDDLVTWVDVTMTEAALGCHVRIPAPDGDVELALEPGMQPGHVVRLQGRGMPVLGGNRRGDLHVRVDVLVPRVLTDEQRALVQQLDTALGEEAYRADGDSSFFHRLRNAFR
jgi:molecular chaperone DnaJ